MSFIEILSLTSFYIKLLNKYSHQKIKIYFGLMKTSNTQQRSKRLNRQLHRSSHDLPHHKVSYWPKIIIWAVLILISTILVIYILASPTIIAPKTLEYNPLFTYFEYEFKVNKMNHKRLMSNLFPQINAAGKLKSKKLSRIKHSNIINIVYGNTTQPYHFDNWLILGDYLSFLANKENKVVRKKIMTHKFAELYNQLKFHDQIANDQADFKLNHKIAQKNEGVFFKFSDKFQAIIESEDIYIEELRKKTFVERLKNFIDGYLNQIQDYFEGYEKLKQTFKIEDGRVWVLWLLHLQGQSLKALKKEFKRLQRKYPTDKFIVLSFYPIFTQEHSSINYIHSNNDSFKSLIKSYLNMTDVHSTLISEHFEYSLLQLNQYVKDEQSFSMYNLVGGRSGYSDLQKIPLWVLDKVEKICKGQKVKTQKMILEQQKEHFYRMGLYKLGSQIMWKNKQVRTNYEFQTGKICKRIPVFHNDYLQMFRTLRKNYF